MSANTTAFISAKHYSSDFFVLNLGLDCLPQIKQASMKLAKVYMKRVTLEFESVSRSDREATQEALLLQGVHFAYRAHQVITRTSYTLGSFFFFFPVSSSIHEYDSAVSSSLLPRPSRGAVCGRTRLGDTVCSRGDQAARLQEPLRIPRVARGDSILLTSTCIIIIDVRTRC